MPEQVEVDVEGSEALRAQIVACESLEEAEKIVTAIHDLGAETEHQRLREALEDVTRFVPDLEEDENGDIEAATIRPLEKGDILRREDVLVALENPDA